MTTNNPDPLVEQLDHRAFILELAERLDKIRNVVDEQAEDEGLWFVAHTAAEAYLQQELRRLHAVVEATRDH